MTRAATATAGEQCSEHQAHVSHSSDGPPGPCAWPQLLLRSSDTAAVAAMTTSTSFLVPWAMVWVVLLRALLVEADLLPHTACSRPVERSHVGEEICGCDSKRS